MANYILTGNSIGFEEYANALFQCPTYPKGSFSFDIDAGNYSVPARNGIDYRRAGLMFDSVVNAGLLKSGSTYIGKDDNYNITGAMGISFYYLYALQGSIGISPTYENGVYGYKLSSRGFRIARPYSADSGGPHPEGVTPSNLMWFISVSAADKREGFALGNDGRWYPNDRCVDSGGFSTSDDISYDAIGYGNTFIPATKVYTGDEILVWVSLNQISQANPYEIQKSYKPIYGPSYEADVGADTYINAYGNRSTNYGNSFQNYYYASNGFKVSDSPYLDTYVSGDNKVFKVVARIPYSMISIHKNPSIYFVYPQSYTFGDWSVYNQPRSYDIGWNLNGDQHTHTYYLNYVNPTSNTAKGNTGNNQTGTTSIVLTPSHARDTIYNVEAVIYDDAKTSLTANANKNFGIFGLPSLSLKVGSAQASSSGNNTSVDVSSDLKLIAGQSVNITIVKGALGSDTGTTSTVNFNVGSTKNDLVHVAGWSNQSNGSSQTLTTTYTPTREGASYVFRAILNHNTSNEIREVYLLGIKTYINPTIDNLTGNDYFSPQDNSTFSWTNNVSSGTSIDSFTQKLTIASSTVNNATYSSNSVVLAPSGNYWVQNIFNNATRSTAVLSSSVTVSLSNSSSGQSVSSTKSFRVQYQPTKQPSSVSISNSGQTICIDDNPTTTISWSYPHTAGAAGVVSGYKVRVYSDSSYSNLVSTKDVSATYLQNNMSVSLNNATDLKRGVLNYVTITPYYTYPSDSTKLEGESNTIYYGTLVKPYKKMGPLTINYPINNTTWHNKYFRVLFTLPIDGDFDTYSSEIQSNYNYSNIQIDVNGTVYDYSTTYTSGTAHPEIFSKDPVITDITNTAQLKMAINPSLISNFADANTFVIKVRAQKGNYYFTSAEMQDSSIKTWSQWATVTLNKTALTEQNLTVGLEIDDTHYMYPHNGINRLLACYPIGSNDNRNIDRARGDLICRSEYQGIYQTMINLINGVNGWCTYDRANVKFNKDIPSFTAIVEIITSAKTGTDRYDSTGRNYMNLLTEYMNNCLQ